MKATKPWNNQRFIGMFDVVNTTKQDSGRYRCIVHSTRGVGVSNYGELTIKRKSPSYTALSHYLPHTPVFQSLEKFSSTSIAFQREIYQSGTFSREGEGDMQRSLTRL